MLKKYKKILGCFIALFFLVFCTCFVKFYFKPFFIIILMTYTTMPVYDFFCKHHFLNEKINAMLSLLLFNIGMLLLLFFIGDFLFTKIVDFMNTDYDLFIGIIEKSIIKLTSMVNLNVLRVGDQFKSFYLNLINTSNLRRGAIYTTEGVVAYFIGTITVYFILVDRYDIVNSVAKLIPKDKVYLIKNKIKAINVMVKIEGTLLLITTVETILSLYILHIHNAVLLGLLCGILDILPYIGTIFVFIPLIFIRISMGEYVIAFGIVCLYILLVVNRQIMEMKFMSNTLNIHPLIMILSIYIGIKVFGMIGFFIGPLYIIIAKEIIA